MNKYLGRPTTCNCCQSKKLGLIENKAVYGKNRGDWPLIWYCYTCKSLVSCHPGTDIPMGLLATIETRIERRNAHKTFDKLWREEYLSRAETYEWLSHQLNIEVDECHLSHFDVSMCVAVKRICKQELIYRRNKSRGVVYSKGRRVKGNGKSSSSRCA